ncbi:MAG: sugar ABC transporter permease [Chloroflexota bacterium]|nr:sugar ABC transporter permease [Chloroflexota bacterium]
MLVLPSLLAVAAVALFPLFQTFRLSFTNTRLGSARESNYVGFDNYERLFGDPQFIRSIWHTLIFTFSSVALETTLGMIVALTIHSYFRGRGLVRASILVPWAIPTVVSALMWDWMFHDRFGIINDMLTRLRLQDSGSNFAWTANTDTSLLAIIAVDVWKTTPFMALLLLAGLQIIPGDVYEASYVDGASKWQQFWQITLPLLRPALLVALIFRTLDAFRVFDVIYVMKGYAPDTMSIAVYTQQALLNNFRVGYGSAAAVIIFLIIGVLVMIYTRLIRVEET